MRYAELRTALAEVLAARPSIAGITAGLHLMNDASLVALIDAIVDSPVGDSLATASYEHPSGFAKLILADGAGLFKLRLHLWPAASTQSDLHNHRWDFGVRVLGGGYRFAEYVMAAGDDWQHYRYFSPGSSDHFRVEDRGRSGIVPTRSGHVSAGSRYTLLADVIHGVQTDADRPTVSLVLQGPDLRACTTVLTRQSKGTAASTDIPVRRLDGERYRRYLLQSRALVAASVGVLS